MKRSHGGTDDETNLAWLCRRCHDRRDAPYVKGRLMPLTFTEGYVWALRFELWWGKDKRSIDNRELVREAVYVRANEVVSAIGPDTDLR